MTTKNLRLNICCVVCICVYVFMCFLGVSMIVTHNHKINQVKNLHGDAWVLCQPYRMVDDHNVVFELTKKTRIKLYIGDETFGYVQFTTNNLKDCVPHMWIRPSFLIKLTPEKLKTCDGDLEGMPKVCCKRLKHLCNDWDDKYDGKNAGKPEWLVKNQGNDNNSNNIRESADAVHETINLWVATQWLNQFDKFKKIMKLCLTSNFSDKDILNGYKERNPAAPINALEYISLITKEIIIRYILFFTMNKQLCENNKKYMDYEKNNRPRITVNLALPDIVAINNGGMKINGIYDPNGEITYKHVGYHKFSFPCFVNILFLCFCLV